MRWAVTNGIIGGITPATLRPELLVTREMSATVLYRMMK